MMLGASSRCTLARTGPKSTRGRRRDLGLVTRQEIDHGRWWRRGCLQHQEARHRPTIDRALLQSRAPGRADWEADALRDIVRDYVIEHLTDDDALLLIDETGFLKQGKASCGVARQTEGTSTSRF
jgi:hypothetical protein